MGEFNRIVIVGNANSTFTKGFIKYVLDEKGTPITLICEKNELFKDFYSENGIKVIAVRENSKVDRLPIVKTLNYIFQVCKNLKFEKSDLVIIHYAWSYLLFVYPFLYLETKTVLVYWGSDLFRASKKELICAKKAVATADKIVVLTDEMKEFFIHQYGYKYKKKLFLIDFGISVFDNIDKIENSQLNKIKVVGEENKDKIVITIGYNARFEQQHEKVTKVLSSLTEEEKSKVILLYPMTYPNAKETYIHEIVKLASSLGFKCKVITKYMDEEEIAQLCVATDVFIHAQTTDALSTSMIEHLYAGTVVLNGNWLHYKFLDKLSIKYISFGFEELVKIVSSFLSNPISENISNKKVLRENCSWERCKFLWENLLDNL